MTKADKEGQRKAPILRFKGFTDDWEQRKLENLFNERKEKSTRGELLSVTLSNGVTKFSDLNKKDNSNIKSGNYKVVKKNDIPYNSMRMWQGASGVSSYDGIVSPAYTVLVPNRNSNSNFYAVLFKKKSILNLFTRFSQGLTSDTWNLKYPILKDIIVPFTNLEEQKRIFKIFNVINNLLALYERKLKLLSQVKKYFLDNLFAEKEYPNLRFKGFTDAWEQRKLLKVCKKEDNKRIPIKEQERKEGNTPYFGANGIQGYIDGYTHDGTNILIAEDGANNVKNYPIKLITGKIWVNNHAHVLKVNTKTNNGNFLVGAIKKINFYRYLVGSSRYKLTAESLNQVKIKIAKQSEQEKIGELLKNIEKLLTLCENKKQNLIEIKNTLLNTMFI